MSNVLLQLVALCCNVQTNPEMAAVLNNPEQLSAMMNECEPFRPPRPTDPGLRPHAAACSYTQCVSIAACCVHAAFVRKSSLFMRRRSPVDNHTLPTPQMQQMMQNPQAMQQAMAMMQSGQLPPMGGMGTAGMPAYGSALSSEMTEDEMIQEAIRRSMQVCKWLLCYLVPCAVESICIGCILCRLCAPGVSICARTYVTASFVHLHL